MKLIAFVVAGLPLAGTSLAGTTYYVPGNFASISSALNSTLVVDGDIIAIAAGTSYEVDLDPNGKAIAIQGTLDTDGSLMTTIDAQQGDSVFVINSGEGAGTLIKDLIITGGYVGGVAGSGGGITCTDSVPTITNCTISGNNVEGGGGGIFCHNCNCTIIDCTISGNTADTAGGISLSSMNDGKESPRHRTRLHIHQQHVQLQQFIRGHCWRLHHGTSSSRRPGRRW